MQASISKKKENSAVFSKNTAQYANTFLSQEERERLRRLSAYKILACTADSTPSYVGYLLQNGVGKQRTAKALAIMHNAKALLAFVEAAQQAYLGPVGEKDPPKISKKA